MNETLLSIKNRRSTKKFQARQISEQELQAILEAGILAPNAKKSAKMAIHGDAKERSNGQNGGHN